MSSARVSSLLDRFKFEQKPKQKLTVSGDTGKNLPKSSSATASGQPAQNGIGQSSKGFSSRSSTPDSDAILCIPETPTSDLPESIESGSPVFPSSKKRLAETSQRSLVSSAISSLLSPGGIDKSPTFGRQQQKSEPGTSSSRSAKNRIEFVDSESESDGEMSLGMETKRSNESQDTRTSGRGGLDSDSTHIDTQDSLETVTYSYEDHSEGSQQHKHRVGGLKRKLSEMSSCGDDEDEEEDGEEEDKTKKDAIEQMRMCFPHKDIKELKRALRSTDWNINQAANEIMQVGSPPKRKVCASSPAETKNASQPTPSSTTKMTNGHTKNNFQSAFSGWLQKPSKPKVILPPPKKKPVKVISSSSEDDDEVVEVPQKKTTEVAKPKKTFKRIRTFSSDSMEDESPIKKVDEVDDDETKGVSTSGKIANSFYKKGSSTQNGTAGKKPFRKVWCGFLPGKGSDGDTDAKKKQSKTVKKQIATTAKPIKARRSARYSDSEEEIQYDDSGSDYEGEDEVTPEFRAKAESFFNDATLEELISIDGCSRTKAQKIISIRPFEDFADILDKFERTKQLNVGIVWDVEAVFKERQTMETLLTRCTNISERIQRLVTSVIENPDGADEGQLTRQPALLNKSMQLKAYQLVGLNWLKLMHTEFVNAILADEMGLGKTIQVIAFLAYLLEEGNQGPHLIVAPSSTLDNWMRELQTWCPALNVILYYGSQDDRKELREDLLYDNVPCNVIVTSYNLCANTLEDRGIFKKLPLQYAIFDEGHMLKNMRSQRFKHLMKIKAEKRLLLTGTPLQNNLQELISLLAFTLPKMVGAKADELVRVFNIKKQKSDNLHEQSSYEMERIAHAKKIMQPFVLRRIKADVLSQLPKKAERVEHVEMTDEQKKGYNELIASMSKSIKSLDSSADSKMSAGKMSSMMMELRKQANHPLLIRRHYDNGKLRKMAKLMLKEPTHYDANEDYIYEDMEIMSDYELHRLCHEYDVLRSYRLEKELVTQSGKFRLLDKLLKELKENGSRVLLFSQFVMVLDIVEEYLNLRGHKFLRMDGQTLVSDRAKLIDKFNNDDSVFIFMLSTRAGGVGINLTAANTVILHDIDFNPYNDKQAEDRCHRVGQTREVSVIRLVSQQTIEEGMLSCAKYKLKLEKQMTSGISGEDGKDEAKDIARLLRDALDV